MSRLTDVPGLICYPCSRVGPTNRLDAAIEGHWAEGGPTTLSNLALLCHRHHRAVHEEGYQVERRGDGTLEFRTPAGRLLHDVPPPPPVPADPVGALRTTHDAQGLQIHARTGMPSWLGERLDVGYAIDVLHPLAIGRPAVRD